MDKERLIKIQKEIGSRALVEDDFEDFDVICGVDQAFIGNEKVVSAAVNIDSDFDLLEKSFGVEDLDFPYIPGLLAFREAPSAISALSSLGRWPDVLLVDGSGIIHPRKAGMATHIGVKLDVPSVGVTKNLLCGELESEPEKVGEKKPIYLEGELVGYSFLTKERCNPVYVSPGHRVSPDTAVEIVSCCLDGYKLPEPIKMADKLVDENKDNYR